MASSLIFQTEVRDIIPKNVLIKLNILPVGIKHEKLCLIARRPLTNDALLELKDITGFEDYELQLVGEDVLDEYIDQFISGKVFVTQFKKSA
ncbi:hypothetical protein GW915_07805 [bacterium]|nr:hypothetical protein [bacterium]